MRTAAIKVKPADLRRLVDGKSLTINLPPDVTTLEISLYTVEDGKKDAREQIIQRMRKIAGEVVNVTERTESFISMCADELLKKL
jgi:VIT1/CCC1 family predicted Fe2+/Mn2+ transporter